MSIIHNDEYYYQNIRNYLIQRAHAVRVDADRNMMSFAVLSEDFYAEFLNVLFDLYLKNANADKSNTAGIDLIDPENHVAVQVSLTCAPDRIREKIQESMRKFDKPDEKMWQFYFVPITDEAPELKKDFSLPEGLVFDKDHDVLDITRLLTIASDCHKLRPLSQLVDKYSKKESDYKELKDSLDRLLMETRKNHRSFKLMHTDDIDRRLFPGVKNSKQFEALGKRKESETESPVWSIIRESWKEPKNHPIMIQGKGGIGKTVTMMSVTDIDKDSLPAPAVYVPMFELVDQNGGIINLSDFFRSCEPFSSLPEEQRRGICTLAAQPWDHGPSLLVLLDGFNEVPGNCRWEVLKMLQKWHTANMGAQLIAVSRPMDNLSLENAFGNNTIAITLSKLKKKNVEQYLKSLNEEGVRVPEPDSYAWNTIIYPLFLTLYIKSERLRNQHLWKDYPMLVRDIAGPGSLIWNYLQRELLRQQNEKWILRCALACEYLAPELAYNMLTKYAYTISQSEAISIIKCTVSKMDFEHMPNHLTELFLWWKRQNLSTEPPYFLKDFNWPEFVLRESGMLIPYRKSTGEQRYEFFHQSFRDCLAGLYLVNQAEKAKDNELPLIWGHVQSHLALDYASELIEEKTADKLWNANRQKMQYGLIGYVKNHSGTLTLLELQKRRRFFSGNLDFSGMDIRNLSLTRYMGLDGKNLFLFQEQNHSNGTMMNRSTFQSEGHGGGINCISVCQNGSVVSGSQDHTLRVWDPTTGQCLHVLKGHNDRINSVTILSNDHILSGSEDGTLMVWNPTTGKCLQTLKGHVSTVPIRSVITLPDSRAVSRLDDGTLQVWDVESGQCLHTLKVNDKAILSMVVLPDNRIVSGSDDGTLQVWDVESGQCLNTLKVNDKAILKGSDKAILFIVAFPDNRIVSGSDDGTLQAWDVVTGECLHTIQGHSGRITCVTALPDGRAVSGSEDGTIRVWDAKIGQCLHTLNGHLDEICSVAVLPDGNIISSSKDCTLRVWNPATGQCLYTLDGHINTIRSVAVLPDDRVVSGSDDKSLRVWDTTAGQCLQTLKGRHSDQISSVAVLPDGHIVSGSADGTLLVWDIAMKKCLYFLEGHTDKVCSVAVLPDGHIVSGSADGTLRVWDIAMRKCLYILEGYVSKISYLTALPDGRVVIGSDDNNLKVWDPTTGQCLPALEDHTDIITCLAVFSDGRVVSGSYRGTLRVWDNITGQCLHTLNGHMGPVYSVTVLQDGRIVSGSFDRTLRIWNSVTGECLNTMKGHSGWITCVTAFPDGQVVSGLDDGTLWVWDITKGKCLRAIKGHYSPIRSIVAITGDCVVSVPRSQDELIRIWNVNSGECLDTIEITEIDVSHMDLSKAVLTNDLAKLLWQNGAEISKADFEKYVRPLLKEQDK